MWLFLVLLVCWTGHLQGQFYGFKARKLEDGEYYQDAIVDGQVVPLKQSSFNDRVSFLDTFYKRYNLALRNIERNRLKNNATQKKTVKHSKRSKKQKSNKYAKKSHKKLQNKSKSSNNFQGYLQFLKTKNLQKQQLIDGMKSEYDAQHKILTQIGNKRLLIAANPHLNHRGVDQPHSNVEKFQHPANLENLKKKNSSVIAEALYHSIEKLADSARLKTDQKQKEILKLESDLFHTRNVIKKENIKLKKGNNEIKSSPEKQHLVPFPFLKQSAEIEKIAKHLIQTKQNLDNKLNNEKQVLDKYMDTMNHEKKVTSGTSTTSSVQHKEMFSHNLAKSTHKLIPVNVIYAKNGVKHEHTKKEEVESSSDDGSTNLAMKVAANKTIKVAVPRIDDDDEGSTSLREISTQVRVISSALRTNASRAGNTSFAHVKGEDSNASMECADDESSTPEAKEEKYTKGVKEINDLSKTAVHGESSEEDFASGIDLEYLQKLIKGKDVEQFQLNHTEMQKDQVFAKIRRKLNASVEKIFNSFENKDSKTEETMRKILEKKLAQEEESVRYKIDLPNFYHAVGTISLPFDDLVEPFEAWYAGELNMSRIDYYYGMDKSYQRGDIGPNGVVIKITPAHWSKHKDLNRNTISCWYKEETKWTRRRAQTIVPMNIKKFKYLGEERFNGVPAYKFFYQKKFVNKNNTYILHVSKTKPYAPLRYEMIGYDHLLRSHYDHYIIDYLSFKAWDFDYKVLQIPKEYKCYEKLRKMKSHFEANPMWDFIHGEEPKHRERELTQTYKDYKHKHKKIYTSHLENHKRKDIFRHNTRFVHSHNRANKNYTLHLNHLADISDNEFEMMKGQPTVDTAKFQQEINEIPQLRLEIPSKPLPQHLDWRLYGAVSPVHSQSFCASCWAFSAVGAIEGGLAVSNGTVTKELAVQQLVDCSWGYENNGCRGGWSWRALTFASEHGIATKRSYGRYLAQEGYCHCGQQDNCTTVSKMSYRTIEKDSVEKLKIALAMYGPGSIAVQCARKTFKFYSSGVYDDPQCTQKTDHAVVVIGYGEAHGMAFWLIKNSWGRLWGDEGYMKVHMKNNLCGVLTNGALMVSFNGWKNENRFPYETMKIVPKTSASRLSADIAQSEYDKDKIELFEMPHHVSAYMRNTRRRKNL